MTNAPTHRIYRFSTIHKLLTAAGAQEVTQTPVPLLTRDTVVSRKNKQSRMLAFAELKSVKGISYSRQHIDRLEKAGKFPRRFKLNQSSLGRNFWWEHEVDEWQRRAAAARDAKKV